MNYRVLVNVMSSSPLLAIATLIQIGGAEGMNRNHTMLLLGLRP